MQFRIVAFGKIVEVIGSRETSLPGVADSDQLKASLEKKYPLLASMNYALAVNRKQVQGTLALQGDEEIALMPPFSGG